MSYVRLRAATKGVQCARWPLLAWELELARSGDEPPAEAAVRGDAGSFSAFELRAELEALHEKSFAWALACCHRDATEAEDVLQSTYEKILDGRARFSGHSSLKTWLFAVVRTTAVESRRRRWLQPWRILAMPELTPPPRPDDEQGEIERRARTKATLAVLAPRQREIIELVFYQELTVEQAAGVMGISVGSARVHYHRAKRRLRERLER